MSIGRAAICAFALLASVAAPCAETYEAIRSTSEPGIDLNAPEWEDVPALTLKSPEEIEFKAIVCKAKLFILLKWKCAKESRAHSPWKWDASLKAYRPGGEEEDAFTLRWLSKPPSPEGELWVWRAGRTDPARTADVMDVSPDGAIDFDQNSACWVQRQPNAFSGEEMPRFVHRMPKGRAAQIQAKGEWLDGYWSLAFAAENPFPKESEATLLLMPEAPKSSKAGIDGYRRIVLKMPPEASSGGAK